MKTPQIFEQVAGGGGGGYYPGAGPVDQSQAPYGSVGALPTQALPDEGLIQRYLSSATPEEGAEAQAELQRRDAAKRAQAQGSQAGDPGGLTVVPGGGYQPTPVVNAQNSTRVLTRNPAADFLGMGEGGGQQQDQGFTGQKYMSMGGTPAKYSRADIAREGALAGRMKGQTAGFMEARDKFTRDTIQQSFGWLQAANNEQTAAGLEAGVAKQEYQRASQSITRNRAILDKMQIDPDRYWKTLPESQKVLNVIGLIFGGLAEGLSGGRVKNAAAQAIQAAQQRDMAAQSANMKKMITMIDMSERDRSHLWSRWEAGEAKRRQAGLAVMQLQLSRAGLMEKRLGIKEQYAGLVNSIDQHMLDVMRQSRGSGGRKVPTPEYALELDKQKMKYGSELRQQEIATAAGLKAGKGKAGDTRGDQGVQNAIAEIPRMKSLFSDPKVALGDLSEGGAEYKMKRGLLGLSLWRMFDSGKLSDADMKMAFSLFFPPATYSITPGMRGPALERFDRLEKWLKELAAEKTSTSPGTFSYSPAQKDGYKKIFEASLGQPVE